MLHEKFILTPTLYTLLPACVALLGGTLALRFSPKPNFVSILQHFGAGVILAALSIELLPKVIAGGNIAFVALGFLGGVIAMVLLHELAHKLSHSKGTSYPLRLVGAGAIDLFIDGVLIGLSFLAGTKSGLIITVSLTLCALFLSLSLFSSSKIKVMGSGFKLIALIFLALMLPIGALLGSNAAFHFGPLFFKEILAAGVAALLYLAIEEFLVEAHRTKEHRFVSLAFFLGFFIVFILTML